MIGLETLAAKVFAGLLLASVLVFGGCRWQSRLDAGQIAKVKANADATVERKNAALTKAAGALNDASRVFWAIDAATQQAADAAEAKQAELATAAKQAKADAQKLKDRIAEIERQHKADAKACPSERELVCGTPLH